MGIHSPTTAEPRGFQGSLLLQACALWDAEFFSACYDCAVLRSSAAWKVVVKHV